MRKLFLILLLIPVIYAGFLFLSTSAMAQKTSDVPLINPLEDLNAYNSVEFLSQDMLDEKWEFSCYDEEENQYLYYIWGDTWILDVPISNLEEPYYELIENIDELGGIVYFLSDYLLIASVKGNDDNLWWAIGEYPEEGSYILKIIKEKHLSTGKVLTYRPGEESREFCFSTDHQGDSYQVFKVQLPTGKIELTGRAEFNTDGYVRIHYYTKEVTAEKSNTYYIDDLPQEKGRVFWTVNWEEDYTPDMITIKLEEIAAIPVIKEGIELGLLCVRGSNLGDVRVRPTNPVTLYHPEFEDEFLDGSLTADGDLLFWLSAGLWDIVLRTDNYSGIEECIAGLIPVNPHELTLVELPANLSTILKPDSSIDQKEVIDIVRAKEKNKDGEIDFLITDQGAKKIIPTLDNTEVFEDGLPGKIKEIGLIKTPPELVLLLDSSGSMKGQMDETISAARKFISSLPEDAFIQVIDFDTTPKLLSGAKKEEVLKSLDEVKANGATALYDTILEGLGLLEGKNRPTLLVFTDGVDANYDDSGPGSKATLDDVISAVSKSNIPLFTIGFGPNHDNTVLLRLAELSGGHYYPASDPAALEKVFASINENLGNTYQLVYERPAFAGISDLPVITLVVDISASMDISPEEEEGCGYRIQKVKNLLHDFILELPDQSLIQLISFYHACEMPQLMTTNKAEILRALGKLYADGGTDIFGSTKAAYLSLRSIPSTKKILIYITDAALAVENKKEAYLEILENIKKQNIRSIWIGLGMEEEDVFAEVAEHSGGKYVISEDSEILKNTFDEILVDVGRDDPQVQDKINLSLVIKEKEEPGKIDAFTGSKPVQFSPQPEADYDMIPDSVCYQTGLSIEGLDQLISDDPFFDITLADGEEEFNDSLPGDGSQASRKDIPLDIKGRNDGVEIHVTGATTFKNLMGIAAPQDKQFLSLKLEFKNVLPEQEVIIYSDGSSHPSSWLNGETNNGKKVKQIPQYLIPDLSNHFFLNWNNLSMYSVSEATWLAKPSLLNPGEYSLTVNPDRLIEGECLFIIPDGDPEQLSIHFYDTAYGHISIPLIGEIDREEVSLTGLPEEEPVKLSDAFSLSLNSVQDFTEIEGIAAGDSSIYRIVEADLISSVQALLEIDPVQVFSLRFPTERGDLVIPLDPITGELPFGFIKPIMVAPGSFNKIRLAFLIPEYLSEAAGELYLNLKEDDIVIPIGDSRKDVTIENGERYTGDGIELVINELAPISGSEYLEGDWVVADVTFFDLLDDSATLINGFFELIRDDYQGVVSEISNEKITENKGLADFTDTDIEIHYILQPDEITTKLLFGVDENTAVIDGTQQRVLIVFKISEEGNDHQWTLESPFYPDLKLSVSTESYSEEELLVQRPEAINEEDFEFKQKLYQATAELIDRYQVEQVDSGEIDSKIGIDLQANSVKTTVQVPGLAYSGFDELRKIDNLEKFMEIYEEIFCLPSSDQTWQNRYAPEAVLTQSWGTENDLAVLTEMVLNQSGYLTERRVVELNEAGKNELIKICGVEDIKVQQLPAISYQETDGEEKLLVIPFVEDLSSLEGLVALSKNVDESEFGEEYLDPLEAVLTVKLRVIPDGKGTAGQLADMSSVLAGEEEIEGFEVIEVFSESIPLETLSLDSIDLSYTIVGKDQGDLYTVVCETPRGRLIGRESVDSGQYKIIGEEIEIELTDRVLKYELDLKEDEGVDGVFHTIGINLPDLREESAVILEEIAQELYYSSTNPDELSALRWYTRKIINQFVLAQSKYEKELAGDLDLITGRINNSRCLLVTVRRHSTAEPVRTTIDLLGIENDIHQGEKEYRNAFNIGSGLFASRLEAAALPGDNKIDLFSIWSKLPDSTKMLWISEENLEIALARFTELPAHLIKNIQNTDRVIIIPDQPVEINGLKRWAWLEVDPENYFTIAVIDTGEHGAMMEKILSDLIKDTTKYMMGAMLGVDIAIWSGAGMTLALSDYDEILAEAEELALEIADMIDFFLANQADKLADRVKIPSLSEAVVKLIPDLDLMPDISFMDGLRDGIGIYFQMSASEK